MLDNLFRKYLEADGGTGAGETGGNNNVTSTDSDLLSGESKTFTQEDLNRIVAREKDKATRSILKNLGFEDTNTAKSKLEELRKLEEDSASLLEKTTKSKDKAELKLGEYEKKVEQLEQEVALMKAGVLPDKVKEVAALLTVYHNEDVTLEDAIAKVKTNFSGLFSDNVVNDSGTGSGNNPPRNRGYSESSFEGIGKRLAETKLKQSGLLKEE